MIVNNDAGGSRRRDPRVCMFCLRFDGPFKSEEHIVPESIGNKEMILPPGHVCDPCNSGRLSPLDQALLTCPPVAFTKTTRYIRNKKNRLPHSQFGKAGLYAVDVDGNSGIELRVPGPSPIVDHDGFFEITLSAEWTPRRWSLVSRAILKMGFQHLALELGKAEILDQRFDGLRRAILVGGSAGWVTFPGTVTPTDGITVFGAEQEPGSNPARLLAGIDLYGLRLSSAWPPDERLLHVAGSMPEADDLVIERFPRHAPDTPRETLTLTATVQYGSRESRGDDVHVRPA